MPSSQVPLPPASSVPIRHVDTIINVDGEIERVRAYLAADDTVIKSVVTPVMVKFMPRDLAQVAFGAALLGIPVSLTQEAWAIGEALPMGNAVGIVALTLILVAMLAYFTEYRQTRRRGHEIEYVKRVLGTYLIAAGVVATVLTLLGLAAWSTEPIVALKQVILITLPAALAGASADLIR